MPAPVESPEHRISGASQEKTPASAGWPDFDAAKPEDFIEALARNPNLIAGCGIEELPAEIRRHERFLNLVSAWLQREPRRAAEWIARQPAEWTARLLEAEGETMVSRSLDAPVELLKALAAPGKHPDFETLLIRLPEVPPRLQALLTAQPPVLPSWDRTLLLRIWAKTDGAAALAFAKANDVPEAEWPELLTAAAKTAPEQAVEELPEEKRRQAVSDVLKQLARENPQEAIRYLQANPQSPAAAEGALAVWQAQLEAGDPAAVETASLFAEALQPYAGIMRARMERDPAKAAEALSGGYPENAGPEVLEEGRKAARDIAGQYVFADTAGALTWALSLPEGWRAEALTDAAKITARYDPGLLSEWLNSVPPSPDLDGVIISLVEQTPDDPEAALAWAGRISDAAQRGKVRAKLLADQPPPETPGH